MEKIYARLIQKQAINKNTGKPWALEDVPERQREVVREVLESIFGVTVQYKNMPTSIEGHNHKVGIKEDKAIRNYEVDTVEEPEGSHLRWFSSYRNKVRTKIK